MSIFRETVRRCSNKHRRAGPFLPGNHPDPGGLKGRGALGEPGRRKHHRERSDRGAWFERRDVSFVITRELCSLERQRVLGVESAEGFLDPGTSYLNTTDSSLRPPRTSRRSNGPRAGDTRPRVRHDRHRDTHRSRRLVIRHILFEGEKIRYSDASMRRGRRERGGRTAGFVRPGRNGPEPLAHRAVDVGVRPGRGNAATRPVFGERARLADGESRRHGRPGTNLSARRTVRG